jgi:hypothetical protein
MVLRISKSNNRKESVIEIVVLTIPYFSTLKSTDANGDTTYQLDSIYGPSEKLCWRFWVWLFHEDLDPAGGFQAAQKYYTNQNSDFLSVKSRESFEQFWDASQNDSFVF